MVFLEMPMPMFGNKVPGDLTFAEIAKSGGCLSKMAAGKNPTDICRNVMTEAAIKKAFKAA